MEIVNEDELKNNQPHFVNDPSLEQEEDDLNEPGMADTDSLLAETDDVELDKEENDSLDFEDDELDADDDVDLDEDINRDPEDEDLD